MSLADTFLKFVIRDQAIIALGNDLKGRDEWFERTLAEGVFPYYVKVWQWPVTLRSESLINNRGTSIVSHVGEARRKPPKFLFPLAEALCDRFDVLMALLRDGSVIATGSTKSGLTAEIPRTQWSRPLVHVDVRNNDLGEGKTGEYEAMWTGLILSVAKHETLRLQAENPKANGRRNTHGTTLSMS